MSCTPTQNSKLISIILLGAVLAHGTWALAEEAAKPPAPFPLQFEFRTAYKEASGKYDAYGDFVRTTDGTKNWTLASAIGIYAAPSPEWDAALSLPITRTGVKAPGLEGSALFVGGPSVDLAYKIKSFVNITLKAGVSLPLQYVYQTTNGVSSTQNRDTEGEDVRASSGFSTGFTLGKPVGNFRFGFDTRVFFTFPYEVESVDGPAGEAPIRIQKGNRYGLTESVTYLIDKDWAISGRMSQSWFLDTFADGVDLTGTAGRNFSTGLSVSRAFKGWKLKVGYETQFPFTSYAVNTSTGGIYSAGVVIGD